ncbi:hypothetical protein P8882_04290 [Bacillus haynesii]|nr:hypothetical protein [Bacillus haynesii]
MKQVDFLESNEMFGDVDEFAFEVAEEFLKRGEVARSSKYYQKVVMARKQVQKGEMLSEAQIDDLLISHTNGLGVFMVTNDLTLENKLNNDMQVVDRIAT